MESQSGIPQDLENVDFDKELVTFSLLPDPPATLTGTVPATLAGTLAGTVPKMLFIYPRLLGRIQVPGVAPITTNTKDTQDPQHAGDPSYLGVGGFRPTIPPSFSGHSNLRLIVLRSLVFLVSFWFLRSFSPALVTL